MQAKPQCVVFLAKDGRFMHKHMVLGYEQINALPAVKNDFETLLSHASIYTVGSTTIHYLQQLIVNDKNVDLPWSDAFATWRQFSEWGTEFIDVTRDSDYLSLHVIGSTLDSRAPYNMFIGLFDAAYHLERSLVSQKNTVSHIIMVDELRQVVHEGMLQ